MKRNFDDVQLGSIELFCLAAELASFTAAAHIAGVTPAAVSRSIGRLEERLGVRLFVRTTRQIRLTDGGKRYYEQCRQALSQLVEAEREVTGGQAAPPGPCASARQRRMRTTACCRCCRSFARCTRAVSFEVHVSNRNIDLRRGLRHGHPRARPGRFLAHRPQAGRCGTGAGGRAFLPARAGTPRTLDDLAQA
jgi:DNA-binding transcriptional LysR family regulator